MNIVYLAVQTTKQIEYLQICGLYQLRNRFVG